MILFMKRILITGKHSFIGNALIHHLTEYHTETISLRNTSWQSEDFGRFDSIVHAAGIAHDSTKNADRELYFAVNSQLAYDAALKAKHDGANQFIFLSSSIVYGKSAPIGQKKIITRDTPVSPESWYGESKVRAEEMLNTLNDDGFKVCILRCPMMYGKDCKGNYPLLSKIARSLPVFPKVHNVRSMLYVKNFAEFVRLMIENDERGVFWPQNREYSDTSGLVKMIAEVHGRRILLLPGCELPLKVFAHVSGMVNKAFGSLAYDMSLSDYREDYRLYDLRWSIENTEKL